MLFQIDFNAATAVYRQLMDQVQHGAASGALKPHDALPGIRPLARQLKLNRNTVAKAYGELENLGIIKTIPGKGCFIEPVESAMTPKIRRDVLVAKIDAALIVAYQLQVGSAEFSELVRERMGELSRKKPKDRERSRKLGKNSGQNQREREIEKRSAVEPALTIMPVVEPQGWSPEVD